MNQRSGVVLAVVIRVGCVAAMLALALDATVVEGQLGISNNGLQCGNELFPFDDRGASHLTVHEARLQDLAYTHAIARRAVATCGAMPMLPGCGPLAQFLMDTRRAVTAARHGVGPMRVAHREGRIRAESLRVLAHAWCLSHASTSHALRACTELAALELDIAQIDELPRAPVAEPVDFVACTAAEGIGEDRVDALSRDPMACLEWTRVSSHVATEDAVVIASERASLIRQHCRPDLTVVETSALDDDIFDAVLLVLEAGASSVVPSAASDEESLTAILPPPGCDTSAHAGRAPSFPENLTFLVDLPPADGSSDAGEERACGVGRVEGPSSCSCATIRIDPNGLLVPDNPVLSSGATICVDVSDFALDQPFEVVLTRGGTRAVVRAPPGIAVDLPAAIVSSTEPILTVDVRGLARGRSLRALAVTNGVLTNPNADGTAPGDSMLVTADIVALADEVRRSRARRAEIDLRFAMEAAIATELTSNTQLQAALEALRVANLTPAPTPASDLHARARDLLRARIRAVAEAFRREVGNTAYRRRTWIARVETDALSRFTSAARETPEQRQAARTALLDAHRAATTAPSRVEDAAARDRERRLRQTLGILCELAHHPIRVVVHDVLTARAHVAIGDRSVVLEYDFEHGYQAPSDRGRHLVEDSNTIFARIQGVPGDSVVHVRVDERLVTEEPRILVGVPEESAAGFEQSHSDVSRQTSLAHYLRDARKIVGFQGTQVVALGRLAGARTHRITVCVSEDPDARPCPPAGEPPAAAAEGAPASPPQPVISRMLAEHRLVVHGQHWLGLRVGLGIDYQIAGTTAGFAAERLGAESNTWEVVSGHRGPTVAVPFIPVLYVAQWMPERDIQLRGHGRDLACDFSDECGLTIHLGLAFGGLELSRPDTMFYPFGVVLDIGGVGVTSLLSVQRVVVPRVTTGERLESMTPPDLDSVYGTRESWSLGWFFGLSFDFDIFQRLYSELFEADGLRGAATRVVGGGQ